MSGSVRETVNARAYALGAKSFFICHCDECERPADPPCKDCGGDGEFLYDDGRCEPCHDKAAEEEA